MILCVNCIHHQCNCQCGGMFIEHIDDNIAESIIKLNHKGYRTANCCGGHEEQQTNKGFTNIYISFSRKYKFTTAPTGFKMSKSKDPEYISYSNNTKKAKKAENGKPIQIVIEEKLLALNEWIEQLPEGPDKPPYGFTWKSPEQRQHHIEITLKKIDNEVDLMPNEHHECDLFLLSSHSKYHANQSLFNFATLGRRNINGWGIGYYQDNEARVIRTEHPAIAENEGIISNEFKVASEVISSPTILGHLRFTSRGTNIRENNHPFKLSYLDYNWLFIHNGSASRGAELVARDRRLLINSNNDSPRIFEFMREKMIDYTMRSPKRSLIEAARYAFKQLLQKDPNGKFNIILSNGHISFVFIHWRPFYLLHREKDMGCTRIISTLKLNNDEEWVEINKAAGKDAKMLVFNGPTLIMNGDL